LRWAQGRPEREAEIAAKFVCLKADLIVTNGSAAPAAMRATMDIPIILQSPSTLSAADWSQVWRDRARAERARET
jgi:ABC-type uncharacterized transport system substrate-binding protein